MALFREYSRVILTTPLFRIAQVSIVFLLIVVSWNFYISHFYHSMVEELLKKKKHFKLGAERENNSFVINHYLQSQKARIKQLQDACADTELFSERTFKRRQLTSQYYSQQYNFSYCKVPKVGCTFWTQVFLILGNHSVNTIATMRRSTLHTKAASILKSRPTNSRVILVTRDPFSRLYSGYIDKIYLGNKCSTRKNIGRENNMTYCNTSNISFSQFLKFIIRKGKSSAFIDPHWAPIFSLCDSCEVKPYRIIKQETFSSDVENFLGEVDIESSKYRLITDILHDGRAAATIPGIIKTIERKIKYQKAVTRCIGRSGVAKRLWISFQIQGFLDENIVFPNHVFEKEGDIVNYTKLSNVILQTVRDHPLSFETSRAQRQKALVSAFQKVDKDIIEGIKDVYGPDFRLFGYNDNPPA